QGRCVTQFITPYRAFCLTHSPEQAVEATPEPGTECLICMEPVEHRKTFNTMVCPACKTTWFHRDCIQGQALSSGILSFQCPLCRNIDTFVKDMFTMGIRMPLRPPGGEGFNTFAEPGDRHRHCDTSECLCPGGRQEAEEEEPWELLLCSSCAAESTQRHCCGLRDSLTSWECDGCAVLGTAPMEEPELYGPNLSTQSGLEPSHEPGSISPGTGNQVPSGMSPSSPAPETSNPSSDQQATSEQSLQSPSQETSSPSTESQVKSDSSHSSSSEPEVSSCSSSPWPDLTQNRLCQQRRTPFHMAGPGLLMTVTARHIEF
ncbi:G2/M phase-specific E3 ubiquitin-protein ligase-like, partial [Corapipo altera]|uniref:G2/M phase-specific E3 ubiquitin-protein ligase-like n=1 Tax=Corapipo altera TaxID=415028 RepID=UPI000FD6873F